MFRSHWIIAAIIAAAISPAAMAFTIGFESSEGYSTGALHDKPSTAPKWTDSTGSQVVDLGGNQAAQFPAPGASVTAYHQASYTPVAATFAATAGAADDPTALGYTGKVAFSFQLAQNTDSSGSSSNAAVAFIRFGRDDVELFLQADGNIQVRSAATDFTVKNNDTSEFDFDSYGLNAFVTISGVADYATQTFTLVVNGVPRSHPTAGVNIPFKNNGQTPANNSFDIITFQNNVAANDAGYRQITIDNINITNASVPEPASAALFGAGMTLLAFHRRSHH